MCLMQIEGASRVDDLEILKTGAVGPTEAIGNLGLSAEGVVGAIKKFINTHNSSHPKPLKKKKNWKAKTIWERMG